jgi:hypothetical protein
VNIASARCYGDRRLALILVEEDFVLQRAAVSGPHDFHGLFRQALPFLDLAGMKCDPGDPLISSIVAPFFRTSRLNDLGEPLRTGPNFARAAILVPTHNPRAARGD